MMMALQCLMFLGFYFAARHAKSTEQPMSVWALSGHDSSTPRVRRSHATGPPGGCGLPQIHILTRSYTVTHAL